MVLCTGCFRYIPTQPVDGAVADGAVADGSAPAADTSDALKPDLTCLWPPSTALLGEWHADGNLDNDAPCSPWSMDLHGNVPYGPGRQGQAWQFRSTDVTGADPDYLTVPDSAGASLASFTLDVWVQQVGFNAYNNSTRYVVATGPNGGWGGGASFGAQIYLHENGHYYLYVKTTSGGVRGADWEVCGFSAGSALLPEMTWMRLTGTFEGKTMRCYRDGKLISDKSVTNSASQPAIEGLMVGRNYPGDVDAVRVLRRALSESEVAAPWP